MNIDHILETKYGTFSPYTMITEIFFSDSEISNIAKEILGEKNQNEAIRIFLEQRKIYGEEKAFQILHELTKHIHEQKHLLDFLGTTFGYRTQNEYFTFLSKLINIFSAIKTDTIYLPLKTWAKQSNCPSELQNWTYSFSSLQKIDKLLFGNIEIEIPSVKPHKLYEIPFELYNLEIPLPVFALENNIGYVIGALNFFESMAFSLQSIWILNIFGKDIMSWWLSMAINQIEKGIKQYAFLSVNHYRFYKAVVPILDFAVSDYCLMGRTLKPQSIDDFCPGSRYLKIYPSILDISQKFIDANENEQINYVIHNIYNTEEIKSIVKNEIESKQELLKSIDHNLKLHDNPLLQHQKEFVDIFLKLSDFRLKNNYTFINPSEFLFNIMESEVYSLPFGLISREPNDKMAGLIVNKEYKSIWWRLQLITLMLDLYDNSYIYCPLKKLRIGCKVETPDCGEGKNYHQSGKFICDYGKILEIVGIIDKNIYSIK